MQWQHLSFITHLLLPFVLFMTFITLVFLPFLVDFLTRNGFMTFKSPMIDLCPCVRLARDTEGVLEFETWIYAIVLVTKPTKSHIVNSNKKLCVLAAKMQFIFHILCWLGLQSDEQ